MDAKKFKALFVELPPIDYQKLQKLVEAKRYRSKAEVIRELLRNLKVD